jgi:hypothetical protein
MEESIEELATKASELGKARSRSSSSRRVMIPRCRPAARAQEWRRVLRVQPGQTAGGRATLCAAECRCASSRRRHQGPGENRRDCRPDGSAKLTSHKKIGPHTVTTLTGVLGARSFGWVHRGRTASLFSPRLHSFLSKNLALSICYWHTRWFLSALMAA